MPLPTFVKRNTGDARPHGRGRARGHRGALSASGAMPPRALLGIAVVALLLLVGTSAHADPLHTPTIDGIIAGDGLDWSPADRVIDDQADDNTGITANLRRLWLTWDADNLYVGITYQDFGALEGLRVILDLDRGAGPADLSLLDMWPVPAFLPDGHGADLLIGRDDPEDFPGAPPTVRRVDDASGATTDITGACTVAQAYDTGAALATARFPFWMNAELAIPWSEIYPGGGSPPARAVLKAVAMVTRGGGSDVTDVAPNNDLAGDPPYHLALLHASILDADGDATIDRSDAAIAGEVVLPQDPGDVPLIVSATLVDWPGRDPGGALSRTVTAIGERSYALPRLPAGRYEVTAGAEGYLDATATVTVGPGEQATAPLLTLARATAIAGTVGFASGPGAATTIVLRDASGAELARRALSAAGGSYRVYVAESGTYILRVEAPTYLPQERSLAVIAGEDLAGVDFLLERQTEISGTVGFLSGPGRAGTIGLRTGTGDLVGSADFPFNGGPFTFFVAAGGEYELSAKAPTYLAADTSLVVTLGNPVTGLELLLPRAPLVSGTVVLEGPDAAGQVRITELATGLADTISVVASGAVFAFHRDLGDHRLQIAATGYVPWDSVLAIGSPADVPLGDIFLRAVRASRLALIDGEGEEIARVDATVSLPGQDVLAPVRLAARDGAGRDDLYDLDGRLNGYRVRATKLDDVSPPTGSVSFHASEDLGDTLRQLDFAGGRAVFWARDDQVEVLRLWVENDGEAPDLRLPVRFGDPQPATVVLTAERDTLVTDGADAVAITARLFDSADNPSRRAGIPVAFSLASSSSGTGSFELATVVTNADGVAVGTLTATGAGMLQIDATVVVDNRTLAVAAGSLHSGEALLPVTAVAGPTAAWRIMLPTNLGDLASPVAVTAQLVDAYGNPTRRAGEAITFSATPSALGACAPPTAVSDAGGRAATAFVPAGAAGVVRISGASAGLPVEGVSLQLRDVVVVTDPPWHAEPATRRTFAATDLTALVIDNDAAGLRLEIPFASDWNGLQLHVLLETRFDAAGAPRDPFEQPVTYEHAHRPDFVLTSKYSADDYGDFRRWNATAQGWEWWNLQDRIYQSSGQDGQNLQGEWVQNGADAVRIFVPWAPLGGRPDSLRAEVYLTQDDDGIKRAAFDSAPSDSTLNLTFDHENPGPDDWDVALGPVHLEAWSEVYRVKTAFATPPQVAAPAAEPTLLVPGQPFVLTAAVTDGGDGVGEVLADLSALGGDPLARMYDDGDPGHGDRTAGDGTWSLSTRVPMGAPGGERTLTVSAFDAANGVSATAAVIVTVEATVEPIVRATDPVGDDHGPNQPGTANKYYTYPTNSAFVPGAFDLTSLDIYETVGLVGTQMVELIAFEVGIVDFPDPDEPGTADWNPLYADLNIQKIDILIDSAPGGATATLPNRQCAFQPWDAWEYAIIMDGWYKAVVPALGTNTVDAWRSNALRTDNAIQLASDPHRNVITAFVSKAVLGNPTAEQIRSWDIAVCMSSHDFGGEEVLGGTRWVNESRSEWNFGGGHYENRDPNLIDLLLVPGSGRSPGRPQEQILDYESPAALQRQQDGLTPCALEITAFEDTGPPVITVDDQGRALPLVEPLRDAPVVIGVRIADDDRVERAVFRYRSTGFTGQGWAVEVPMGYAGNDLWSVDIRPTWLDSNLVYSPVDSSRYLEFEVTAWDRLDKQSTSPVTTLQVALAADCRDSVGTVLTEGATSVRQVDGSVLTIDDPLRRHLLQAHLDAVWPGGEITPDSAGVQLAFGICTVDPDVRDAPAVPAGRPLGIFREIYLGTVDALGGVRMQQERLPRPAELKLHYPQEWLPAGADENQVALYAYNEASHRWVVVGGHVSPAGNDVTANVLRPGIYGLFHSAEVEYDAGEVLSGVLLTPNPFSPNDDGLYDECTISFYLSQEATVTAEIYNIDGKRKRLLTENFSFSGDELDDRRPRRVPGLVWDGRDHAGDLVPYGIYVVRLIATYNQAGGTRTIRSNHALAVIR
ncbi:MAG: glucodextranase DOMON-like domain-containing protein [Candidatus Krumholzibacteriia bacterium]